jgi:hypothetical protein
MGEVAVKALSKLLVVKVPVVQDGEKCKAESKRLLCRSLGSPSLSFDGSLHFTNFAASQFSKVTAADAVRRDFVSLSSLLCEMKYL